MHCHRAIAIIVYLMLLINIKMQLIYSNHVPKQEFSHETNQTCNQMKSHHPTSTIFVHMH